MPLGVDLDGEVRRVDPDRWLTSRFIADLARRAGVVALYALDHELARAESATSNPLAAEVRLVWWSETLAEIYAGRPVRRHPVAEATASAITAYDLPHAPFETLIRTRIGALGVRHFAGAGARAWSFGAQASLAGLAARVLGGEAALAEPAGLVWGLHRLSRDGLASGVEAEFRSALWEAAGAARRLPVHAFPAALPAALARAPGASELSKRMRLTWSVMTGRL